MIAATIAAPAEFFCGNDAWRPAVKRLMAESDLVAMDLRGFSAANQGCLFELQSLIDTPAQDDEGPWMILSASGARPVSAPTLA